VRQAKQTKVNKKKENINEYEKIMREVSEKHNIRKEQDGIRTKH